MDVIALHQAGFTHAVAPLGTALTEAQLQLLWRASSDPVLCLDGDGAGLRAMQRAAELALPHMQPGRNLAFAVLPPGEDPDSFIRKAGPEAMRGLIEGAIPLSQWLWQHGREQIGLHSPEKKAALEAHLNAAVARVLHPAMRQHLQHYFRDQLYQVRFNSKQLKNQESHVRPGPLPEVGDDQAHLRRIEEQIIGILLLFPELLLDGHIEEQVAHMDFLQPGLDKLRAAILEVAALAPPGGSEAMRDALASRGHAEQVDTLLHSIQTALSPGLRAVMKEQPLRAAQVFSQAYHGYTLKKLEREMHEAEMMFTQDMSERNLTRLCALKSQIDDLRKAPYALIPDEHVF